MARNHIFFHYDGPIVQDHHITARTLGHTLTHLQGAIDRAAIDLKHGSLAKHARLKTEEYPLTDFIVGYPEEGGFILNLFNAGPLKLVDRMSQAVARAYQEAAKDAIPFTESLVKQAERRTFAVQQGAQTPAELGLLAEFEDEERQRLRYADRAINREIDQVLAQLRVDRYEGSTLELQFAGDQTSPKYIFDAELSKKFHGVVAVRVLGDPVRLTVKIRAADGRDASSHPVGKAIHVDSGRTFTLHFKSADDFNSVVPFLKANKRPEISIIACPILEYGVFDSKAGDMFFIAMG